MLTIEALDPVETLLMPEYENFELVDGELREKPMGTEADGIGSKTLVNLENWNQSRRFGRVLGPHTSYQCFPDDVKRVRRPDVSVISFERLPGRLPRGHTRVPPEVAVEVISPTDLAVDVRRKVAEYLKAGVSLIWIIDPDTRTVEVCRADGSANFLGAADDLSGETVLPEFTCRVADLFASVDPDGTPNSD
jgi:Uma2 family endonuclease